MPSTCIDTGGTGCKKEDAQAAAAAAGSRDSSGGGSSRKMSLTCGILCEMIMALATLAKMAVACCACVVAFPLQHAQGFGCCASSTGQYHRRCRYEALFPREFAASSTAPQATRPKRWMQAWPLKQGLAWLLLLACTSSKSHPRSGHAMKPLLEPGQGTWQNRAAPHSAAPHSAALWHPSSLGPAPSHTRLL